MAKALWNGVVIAESDTTEIIEGNHYFPPDSIHRQYFREQATLLVVGKLPAITMLWWVTNRTRMLHGIIDTKQAVEKIRDHVAFWKGLKFNREYSGHNILRRTRNRNPKTSLA